MHLARMFVGFWCENVEIFRDPIPVPRRPPVRAFCNELPESDRQSRRSRCPRKRVPRGLPPSIRCAKGYKRTETSEIPTSGARSPHRRRPNDEHSHAAGPTLDISAMQRCDCPEPRCARGPWETQRRSTVGFQTNRSTNSNASPSNSPLSLSLSWGMTRRAMKERVMNGASIGLPSSSCTK